MVLGSRYSLGVFKAFSDLHRKTSDRSVCNTAGLIQTSENVCIPDVSVHSVLDSLHMAFVHLERQKMS